MFKIMIYVMFIIRFRRKGGFDVFLYVVVHILFYRISTSAINNVLKNLQDLSYKDRHWHEQCFKCAKCNRSLVEKAFAAKDDLLLCTECYANDYSSKCTTCKKTVMPGMLGR